MPNRKLPPSKVAGWKGYTIDELRYQRAYVAARLELSKGQMLHDVGLITGGIGSPEGPGIIGRFLGYLSYFDYVVIGFKLFRQVRSMLGSLRKK